MVCLLCWPLQKELYLLHIHYTRSFIYFTFSKQPGNLRDIYTYFSDEETHPSSYSLWTIESHRRPPARPRLARSETPYVLGALGT